MDRIQNRKRAIFICLLLTVITLAAFWPVLNCDFIKLDDQKYVVDNGHVLGGLTWENVKWSLQAGYASNWHPLTWMSHMLDVQLFGLRPGWHHLVNLLLHIANSILLFLLFQRMTGATWRSAFGAALFALHPLHVESVAWISERKDMLSTFFFLLTLGAYVRYAQFKVNSANAAGRSSVRKWTWYGLALLLFAAGLMSKPMLVTLPFVLLLLDLWPLGRFRRSSVSRSPRSTVLPLLYEKLPFLALCAGSSLITFLAQQRGQSVSSLEGLPPEARLANAIASYWKYLAKMVWPTDLAVFYPHPAVHSTQWADWQIQVAGVVLAAVSLFAILRLKREPWFFTGWFWFLGTLVPVIGIVQVGSQGMADRYTYIPLIGIFVCLAWVAAEVCAIRPHAKTFLAATGALLIVACAGVTRNQASYWRSDVTLFEHALRVTANNAVAHTIMGEVLLDHGDFDLAKKHFQDAIEADPNHANARMGLCAVLAKQAFALAKTGKLEDAVQQYTASLQAQPSAIAYNGRGAILWQLGKVDDALHDYSAALQLDAEYADAHYNLGAALAATGKLEEAASHFAAVIRLKPDHSQAFAGLGRVLAMQGKLTEAKSNLQESLRLESRNLATHLDYAMCLSALQEPHEAIAEYRKIIALNDQMTPAYNNLAWMLATYPDPKIRDGKEAIQLAERACRLTNNEQPGFLGTLAAAYAEAGRFEEAVAAGQKARDLAQKNGLTELADRNEELLKLYRAGKAFHETTQIAP